jgi:hypothetical protein
LYELVIAENLIVNRIPHQYEKTLRCDRHLFFPDFFVRGNRRTVLIEVSGISFKENWNRLLEKLTIYRTHRVADVLVVVYVRRDASLPQRVVAGLARNARPISIDDVGELATILRRAHYSTMDFRTVTDSESIRRGRPIAGKQIHWQRLLLAVPKESWIDALVNCGIPEAELRRVRIIAAPKPRLVEATHLAIQLGLAPREALVEMIAGSYNGAAGDYFGSMSNLVQVIESGNSERFT